MNQSLLLHETPADARARLLTLLSLMSAALKAHALAALARQGGAETHAAGA